MIRNVDTNAGSLERIRRTLQFLKLLMRATFVTATPEGDLEHGYTIVGGAGVLVSIDPAARTITISATGGGGFSGGLLAADETGAQATIDDLTQRLTMLETNHRALVRYLLSVGLPTPPELVGQPLFN